MLGKVIALVCLTLGLAIGSVTAAEFPRAEISNGLVHARLYLPDPGHGYYRATRFDWSGVFASLEYKGHSYYGPWFQKTDPKVRDFVYDGPEKVIVASAGSAMTGPAEEFVTAQGYDEAKAGGTFIKIGVGILRKPDDLKYDHFKPYEVVDPGKWTVHKHADSVEFIHEVNDLSSGYAYVYRKTVRLTRGKPEMVLEHSLKNTGRRVIDTSAYDHNFLVLDKQSPGPEFVIAFPFEIKTDRPPKKDLAEIRGNQIVYLKTLENEERATTPVQGFSDSPKDYDIRIENRKVGAGMRITADCPLRSAALWSIRTVLCVEPFITIAVDPEREFTWKISYTFYSLSSARN